MNSQYLTSSLLLKSIIRHLVGSRNVLVGRAVPTAFISTYDRARVFGEYASRQRIRSSLLLSVASVAAAVVAIDAYSDSDDETASGLLPRRVPLVVNCAEVRPPMMPSKERLAAIRSLDVIADVVEEVAPAVVSLTTSGNFLNMASSTGSGFIVDDTGLIITNAHVVGRKQCLKVNTRDGREFNADVLAVDITSDLALVKIQTDKATAASLPRLRLAPSSQKIRPGQLVIALGSPLMLSNTVTMGVVSAVERDLGHRSGLKYIQTDAIITFGNSGGPLVSLHGEVVGVNTMIADTGVGFAVPFDQVQRFIDASLRALESSSATRSSPQSGTSPGRPKRSLRWFGGYETADEPPQSIVVDAEKQHSRYLGLVMRTLTPDLLFDLSLRDPFGRFVMRDVTKGVIIHGVMRGSPAERAGLLPGDVIVAIDDQAIVNAGEVNNAVESKETMSITVVRHGKRLEISNVSPESI